MWAIIIADSDNLAYTPILYKVDTEEKAKKLLKNTYRFIIETERIFEMVEYFKWDEFGDNDLKFRVTFHNGAFEEYIAMEVSDSYSQYEEVVYWFSEDKDPFITTARFPAKLRFFTKKFIKEYLQKHDTKLDAEPYMDDEYMCSDDPEDNHSIYDFLDGCVFVVRRLPMMDVGDKTYFNCEDYYE